MSDYSQTQSLVDAGKFAALTILLCLFTIFVPLFWFFALAICPVPTLIITRKHGFRYGLLTAFASGILLVLVVGPIEGVPLLLIVTFLGVGQGLATSKKLPAGQVVTVGVLAVATGLIILGLLAYFIGGVNLVSEQAKMAEYTIDIQKTLYLRSGLSDNQVEAQLESLRKWVKDLPYLLPSGILLFSCWVAFLNYWVSTKILKRENLEHLALPLFKNWRFPWYFSSAFVLGLAGVLLYQHLGSYKHVVQLTGFNLLFVFSALFLIQGISITWFFLDKYKLAPLAKIVLLIVALLVQILFQGLTFLGLFDTWFDFRKLLREE